MGKTPESIDKKINHYSLQPVVVKKLDDDKWELIDGQQRLTTLWLIFNYMHKGGYKPSGASYSLAYETRPGSEGYLESLDTKEALENIDYFHLHQAFATIGEWFDTKASNSQMKVRLVDRIHGYLCDSVRVIWYEASRTVSSIPLFTRLNRGRIPLTDAELIKAVLLTQVQVTKPGRETEIAAQWDGIERDLQRDEIWAFVAGSNAHQDQHHGPRIGMLLDTLAHKPAKEAHRYHTFEELHPRIATDSLVFWDEVVALHAQILGWFETPHLYNKIGFLTACGTRMGDIQDLAQGKNKSAFDELLVSHIKRTLDVKAEELEDDGLSYQDARRGYLKLQQLLLLFNVKICRERFPFDKHIGQDWTLEHIHAQNAQSLTRADQWAAWLTEHRQALNAIKTRDNKAETEALCKDIDNALPDTHSPGFGERFATLAARVQMALQPAGEVAGADHSIANLALLSHGANAALSNAVFEVKRQKVLAMDRAGEYVPVATRNVFLKYYTDPKHLQPHFWGEADKTAYLSEIKKRLECYLK
ncbi:MAG: DUF262 domain-containing protein [Gammaproteobacteria bacterium]|nr:DUF262 domain-containing protein [Gammaproteobacteria bacterium]MBK9427154.1 DUF262 domain-containing protein [Gammaproteobacteria bacterium]